MDNYVSPHVLIIALTFFLAGIVKGVAGMGLPTVAMGILGAIMSPVSAASLLVIPSFVTNFWQLFTGPNFLALMQRLWLMMLGIVVGTLAGSWLLTSANTEYASVGLGSALVLYAVHSLWAKPFSVPARLERFLSPAVGLTTGIINGGTGVFTIPAVPYLQALGLSKDHLIQALGLSFTVSTVALSFNLIGAGALNASLAGAAIAALIAALAGMWVGQLVRLRLDQATFRRWFFLGLLLLGIYLSGAPMLRALIS